MVDAIVSFAVQKLGDFLIQEAVSLRGVTKEVESLKTNLERALALLKDAEKRQVDDAIINKWVSDITDVAYEAEDIIDKFILKQEEKGRPKAFLERYCCIYKQANLYRTGEEINALKNKLGEIQEKKEAFGITNMPDTSEGSRPMNESLKWLRKESLYEEEDVVGFKKEAESLMSEVLKDEPHRCVVAIVGMGGLGKTTLARKLYNDGSLRENFDCRAWVSVSNEYKIEDLLQRIIKSFEIPTTKEEWGMLHRKEDLALRLRKYLDGKRYMVVMDDIWDADAWPSLKRAFPDQKNGSRVVMTTRNKAVAERFDERTYVYELPFLKNEESWELFCKKAFLNYDVASHNCPQNLERLARDMVSRCGAIPLAIVVLGGLLSRKHPDEWPKLQQHVSQHVIKDESARVEQFLALSFNDLPYHLKACFLYLGLFPDHFEIEVDKLIRLWVAEGFIIPKEALELEEIAAEYLNELIDRNLIQIARKEWKRIATCQIHDLLRNFAIEKSKELNFLHTRRVTSQEKFGRFVSFHCSNELQLRTLLFFNLVQDSSETSQLEFLIKKLRLLRVLDLNGIKFNYSSQAPNAIGKLIHLRYLGLTGTYITELPSSIGRLKALQTLCVDYNLDTPVWLPDEICNAKELRHLIGCFKWPFRIEYLTNLRTLDCVRVDGNDQMEFDPVNLVHLRELQVHFEGSNKIYSLDSIGKLKSLRTLFLYVNESNSSSYATLEPLSNCQNLLQLKLFGAKGKLPTDFHKFLPKLKYLLLGGQDISEDPMPALEKLLDLTFLDLIDYDGDKLDCTASGFPQLKILRILYCDLQELHVEEGGMPVLTGLEVPANVRLPQRLRSIPAPENWGVSINVGEDWPY